MEEEGEKKEQRRKRRRERRRRKRQRRRRRRRRKRRRKRRRRRRRKELFFSPHAWGKAVRGHREKVGICKPQRALARNQTGQNLDPRLSITVRSISLLFKPHSLWHFAIVDQAKIPDNCFLALGRHDTP